MCRNIRTLLISSPGDRGRGPRRRAQYVRKVSGFHKPSRANAEAFDRAIDAVAAISHQLIGELTTSARPKDREVEAAKAAPGLSAAAPPDGPGHRTRSQLTGSAERSSVGDPCGRAPRGGP